MSSRMVDGVAIPLPVAGHPGLDFCNTRAGWNGDEPKEYLRSPRVLVIWAREAGLITAQEAGRCRVTGDAAQAVLHRTIALRDAMYRISLGRSASSDWDLMSTETIAARASSHLIPGTPVTSPATWRLHHTGPELPLLAVAAVCAELVTGPLAGTVGACPGDGCGWLFSDPRHRRRWC